MEEDRRIFVVGDIHGCHDKLRALLARIDWKPHSGDLLLFLGDYIDRGPNSYFVVETLLELIDAAPNSVISLMGNHEKMFLDFLNGVGRPDLFTNGLASTVLDYCRAGQKLSAGHLMFYRNLRLFYESENYIFVHAGLRPGKTLEEQAASDLLWIREPFFESEYDFGKTVVFGHTPFKEAFIAPGRLGLDTGAVYGGSLTCCVLPEMSFIAVD